MEDKFGKRKYKIAEGRHTMRPPSLHFKKTKDTKDYKEYLITTFKDLEKKSDFENWTENSLSSFIFCNPTLTIQMPKPDFMVKNNRRKFAYVSLMFPAPKTKLASYTDGCILTALGLRRQGVNADIICLVTPDISKEVQLKLLTVYDDVKVVPYITPFPFHDDDIVINKDIFKNCKGYTQLHPYSHVFTKLHMFNPDIMPYEKVVFVDSDLVPMNYYDSLFMLNTPAGFVEYRKKTPFLEAYNWDRCDLLEHGKPIPKHMTDLEKKTGADVNAGLLVVTPNKKEYNAMIKELKSPIHTWMGKGKEHQGFWDMDFSESASSNNRKFVENSYCFPEQNYLTKRYSGKWTFVEFAFQSWSLDPCNSFGIHMAAFNPKPWFKQPAGLVIDSTLKLTNYSFTQKNKDLLKSLGRNDKLLLQHGLPLIIDENDKLMSFENITYAYEIFNELMIWGLINYPPLKNFFLENLTIHGRKISFGMDNFKPLDAIKNINFMKFKDIELKSKYYKVLSKSQKKLIKIMKKDDDYLKKYIGKYSHICKNKSLITSEDGKQLPFNYTIISYNKSKSKSTSKSTSKSKFKFKSKRYKKHKIKKTKKKIRNLKKTIRKLKNKIKTPGEKNIKSKKYKY